MLHILYSWTSSAKEWLNMLGDSAMLLIPAQKRVNRMGPSTGSWGTLALSCCLLDEALITDTASIRFERYDDIQKRAVPLMVNWLHRWDKRVLWSISLNVKERSQRTKRSLTSIKDHKKVVLTFKQYYIVSQNMLNNRMIEVFVKLHHTLSFSQNIINTSFNNIRTRIIKWWEDKVTWLNITGHTLISDALGDSAYSCDVITHAPRCIHHEAHRAAHTEAYVPRKVLLLCYAP